MDLKELSSKPLSFKNAENRSYHQEGGSVDIGDVSYSN